MALLTATATSLHGKVRRATPKRYCWPVVATQFVCGSADYFMPANECSTSDIEGDDARLSKPAIRHLYFVNYRCCGSHDSFLTDAHQRWIDCHMPVVWLFGGARFLVNVAHAALRAAGLFGYSSLKNVHQRRASTRIWCQFPMVWST